VREVENADRFNTIVSVHPGTRLPRLQHSIVLMASQYLTINPGLHSLVMLREYYGRPIGYSDHTVGIEWCQVAFDGFGCDVIEKHFTLTRDIYHGGKQFRDAIHSATPNEFAKLAKWVGL
jgi:sialic acid synthase SpsE